VLLEAAVVVALGDARNFRNSVMFIRFRTVNSDFQPNIRLSCTDEQLASHRMDIS
jgi:hypothetical protein